MVRALPTYACVLAGAMSLLAGASAASDAKTQKGQALLLEAIEQSYREVNCVAYYTSDIVVDRFFARMDVIAEEKFRAAGLTFPETLEERDAAFQPIFQRLFDNGLIIEEQGGDIDRFPSACED